MVHWQRRWVGWHRESSGTRWCKERTITAAHWSPVPPAPFWASQAEEPSPAQLVTGNRRETRVEAPLAILLVCKWGALLVLLCSWVRQSLWPWGADPASSHIPCSGRQWGAVCWESICTHGCDFSTQSFWCPLKRVRLCRTSVSLPVFHLIKRFLWARELVWSGCGAASFKWRLLGNRLGCVALLICKWLHSFSQWHEGACCAEAGHGGATTSPSWPEELLQPTWC